MCVVNLLHKNKNHFKLSQKKLIIYSSDINNITNNKGDYFTGWIDIIILATKKQSYYLNESHLSSHVKGLI